MTLMGQNKQKASDLFAFSLVWFWTVTDQKASWFRETGYILAVRWRWRWQWWRTVVELQASLGWAPGEKYFWAWYILSFCEAPWTKLTAFDSQTFYTQSVALLELFSKQFQKIHSWQKETSVYSLWDYEPFKIKVQRLVLCHHNVFIMKIIVM